MPAPRREKTYTHSQSEPQLNRAARRWATRQITCKYLGVASRTLDDMIADGRIREYRMTTGGAKTIRFDLGEIDASFAPTLPKALHGEAS